jgi:hypothetical protein
LTFRDTAKSWAGVSEQAYMAARLLPFEFARPSAG